ncbi:MAG: HAD family hydrolase [Candidatus Methylacidiphilales bacterium]|nr:HAD family phosphatase [Candidatus Methylacidiphilales bacterium]
MSLTIPVPAGKYDAFLFDCDGTLADSMPIHYKAWTSTIETMTGKVSLFDEPFFYTLGGIPTRKIVGILNDKYGYTFEAEETAHEKELEVLRYLGEIRPINATVNLVKSMGKDAKKGVASGGLKHIVEHTLDVLGIHDYFQTIVAADCVEHGKPAPDMYLLAAKNLGVSPSRCLVFEDAIPGFEAAKAAGMDCIDVRAYYDK